MRYLATAVLFSLISLFPSQIQASEPVSECICDENVRYENVFNASITNVVKLGDDYVATAKRGKIHEGYQNETVEIRSEVGECEFLFSKNNNYTVYAWIDRNGDLRTDVCSNTAILTDEDSLLSSKKASKNQDRSTQTLPFLIAIITIAGGLAMLTSTGKK